MNIINAAITYYKHASKCYRLYSLSVKNRFAQQIDFCGKLNV